MRKLLILLALLWPSLSLAAVYTPSAFRINGTSTATCTGTVTTVGTAVTGVSGCSFVTGGAWTNAGIIINAVQYSIASVSSTSSLTLASTAGTQASPVAFTVITSACITTGSCNGWVGEVDVPTIGTTGTFSLGLGTNNSPKNAVLIFTVTSSGYKTGANCGSTTTYTRTLYATHILREPYPFAATSDVTSVSGTTTFRFALAGGPGPIGSVVGPGWIFSGDTVTVQVAGSFFTDGSSNTVGTVAAGTSVTNNSTLAYSTVRAIGSWSWPGFQRVTGTFNLRAVAYSAFANNGMPVACVKFSVLDAHSDTNTTLVSHPTIDITVPDKNKVTEYIASMSTSGLTNHDKLTFNYKIYPWIGDSTAVLDSSDGTNSAPTPNYSSAYGLLDTTNNYSAAGYVDGSFTMSGAHTSGTFVAGELVTQQTSSATAYLIDVTGANGAGPIHLGQVVSGTWNTTTGKTITGGTSGAVFTQTTTQTFAGSDSNSCAAAESGGQPGSPCRTIDGALVKMAAYNNASSTPTHNDACGTLFMEKGYYNWTGASNTDSTTTANCWANLTTATGATQAQVVIDQQSGNQYFGSSGFSCTWPTSCGTMLHLLGITINIATAPVSVFNSGTYIWIDQCSVTMNGTAPLYQVKVVYATDSVFPSTLAGYGFQAFGGVSMSPALIRGNDVGTLYAGGRAQPVFTWLGNTSTTAGNGFLSDNFTGQAVAPTIIIAAHNTFYKWQEGTNGLLSAFNPNSGSNNIGAAFVQNICENITASDSSPAMVETAADSSTGTPIDNVMLWENVDVGARHNRAYNDSGSVIIVRQTWQEVGEIVDDVAIKSDTFAAPASPYRTGNWAEVYGTGNRSEVYASTNYSADGGEFCNEFYGLNVNAPTVTAGATQPPTCSTNSNANYPQYKNRQASTGSGGTGGGDYRVNSNSPAVNMVQATSQVMPYDLEGQIRNNSGYGSAGAFEQAKILTPAIGWW